MTNTTHVLPDALARALRLFVTVMDRVRGGCNTAYRQRAFLAIMESEPETLTELLVKDIAPYVARVGKWLPEGHEAELAKWLPVCEELRKWLGPAKQDATAKPTLPNHLRLTLLKFGMKTQFYQTNNSYHMGLSKHIQNITRSDILGLMVILDGMQKHDGKYKDNEEFVSACHELESWLDEATQ